MLTRHVYAKRATSLYKSLGHMMSFSREDNKRCYLLGGTQSGYLTSNALKNSLILDFYNISTLHIIKSDIFILNMVFMMFNNGECVCILWRNCFIDGFNKVRGEYCVCILWRNCFIVGFNKVRGEYLTVTVTISII